MGQAQIQIETWMIKIPFLKSSVWAGFPSPADDYLQKRLNPKDLLEQNPAATFYMRISGDSWAEYGIRDGDHVVIDRSISPMHGKPAVVTYQGEFTIQRIGKVGDRLCFLGKNNDTDFIPIEPESEVQVWGIITFVLHRY